MAMEVVEEEFHRIIIKNDCFPEESKTLDWLVDTKWPIVPSEEWRVSVADDWYREPSSKSSIHPCRSTW